MLPDPRQSIFLRGRALRVAALSLTVAFANGCCDESAPDDTSDTGNGTVADTAADAPGDGSADTDGNQDATADASADARTWPAEPDRTPLGGDRPADVLLPRAYDATRPWPLVVMLHGFGASGLLQRIYLQLPAQVDVRGFILVTPDGTVDPNGSRFWNAWQECCDFSGTNVDDVGYLLGLLDEAEQRYNVDLDRVYFMGHSNGGFMSFRMACEAGDRIAGIMQLAGAMPKDPTLCNDAGPVAILSVHGTNDDTIPFESTARYAGAVDSLATWIDRGGCGAEPTSEEGPAYTLDTGTTVTRWDCAAADVELWALDGAGHLPSFSTAFAPAMLDWLLARPRTARAAE